MEKKIILIGLMLSCLLISSNAVPYPNLEGQKDSSQIPYCLNQKGHKCLVCGPTRDLNNTALVVPTAQNVLQTACLPSKNGCVKFADMTGQVCDSEAGCYCGFAWNPVSKTCEKSPIENCARLHSDGKMCHACVSPLEGHNIGGGLNDYGLSNDMMKCIDNFANNRTNCAQYRPEDKECGSCRSGYYLTADFSCVQPPIGTPIVENCLFGLPDGSGCQKCQPGYDKSFSGSCDANGQNRVKQETCFRYGLDASGMNPDYTLCLQCVPGSLLLANGKCSDENNLFVFDGTGIRETGNYIGNDGDVVLPWCAYAIYIQTGGSWAPVCVLYKSDPYVSKYFTTPPPMATFGHDDCDDYDYVNKECKSNGCNDISATYFTDLKYCIKSDCQLKGCATTDSTNAFGQCLSCQPGYRLFDGKCWIKPRLTEVTSCIDYDDQTLKCSQCEDQYKLNTDTNSCDSITIEGCIWYLGSTCRMCSRNRKLSEDKLSCPYDVTTEFGGVHGCKAFSADGVCTTCMSHFVLSADGKKCIFHHPAGQNCAMVDAATGQCVLCNDITYSFHLSINGEKTCKAQVATYCEVTMDDCHCLSCKPGFVFDQTGNGQCVLDPTGIAATYDPITQISGCIKYQSPTECEVCQHGRYILADNKTCYSLELQNLLDNPDNHFDACSKASTQDLCSECPLGTDAGLMSFSTGYPYPIQFCISQGQNLAKGGGGQRRRMLVQTIMRPIKFCKLYPAENYGSTCDVCTDGYNITTDQTKCVSAQEELATNHCSNYSTADNACTACELPYILDISSKTCKIFDVIHPNGCQTYDQANSKCSACLPGWYYNAAFTCTRIYGIDGKGPSDCEPTGTCFTSQVENKDALIVVKACAKGSVLTTVDTDQKTCFIDTSVQTNCQTVNKIYGFCEECQSGFVLHLGLNQGNTKPEKRGLNTHSCIPAIEGCTKYPDHSLTCSECSPNADGVVRRPSADGTLCLTAAETIENCATYSADKKCTMCQPNTGTLETGCKLPIENCISYSASSGICDSCLEGYDLSSQGLCIVNHVNNCQFPYDSYLCAQCKAGFTLIPTKDNQVSAAYGLCANRQIDGCLIANAENTKCLRCEPTDYALIDGTCFKNDGSDQFPWNCIHYTYNQTGRALYCDECDRGYGITANNTRCLINHGACTNSIDKDCFKYDKLVGYELVNNCTSFDRPSFSGLISVTILSLFAIIFIF